MVIKKQTKATSAMQPGVSWTELLSIKGAPTDEAPVSLQFHYKIEGFETPQVKTLGYNLNAGSPLRHELDVLAGRKLSDADLEAGCDLLSFVGSKRRIVLMAKIAQGGKPGLELGPLLANEPGAKNA